MLDKQTLKAAHDCSIYNKSVVEKSTLCGCFYCLRTFPPNEIKEYVDKEARKGFVPPDQTALCPHCGIDSVLGDASGYPLTQDFLKGMGAYWFSDA